MDKIDKHILSLLQRDASMSVSQIADRVGLSASPCWRRIRQMETQGIITTRVAILDKAELGLDFEAYAVVKLAVPSGERLSAFEKRVMQWPEVVECATVTGAVDYMLRILTTDIAAYDRFLRTKLLAEDDVSDVQTRIVVRTVKRTTELPLHLVE
jgi:DNA-binding Lrp family transcriptional regulator